MILENHEVDLPADILENNLSLRFVPSKRKSVAKIIVHICGNLDINNVEKLMQPIKTIISKYKEIELHLTNIEKIDLSVIQLLYYFIKMAQEKEIIVFIKAEIEKDKKLFLGKCGFLSMFENGKVVLN